MQNTNPFIIDEEVLTEFVKADLNLSELSEEEDDVNEIRKLMTSTGGTRAERYEQARKLWLKKRAEQ